MSEIQNSYPVVNEKKVYVNTGEIKKSSEIASDFYENNWNKILEEYSYEDNNLFEFFWGEKIKEIANSLWEIGLDIKWLLIDYKELFENDLASVPEDKKSKIITAITNKISSIYWDIKDSLKEEGNKWIINKMILNELSFINNELLPTLKIMELVKAWEEIPEEFRHAYNPWKSGEWYNYKGQSNEDYIDFKYIKKELDEVLNSKVNEEWDFDEWFFSVQKIIDWTNSIHNKLLTKMGVENERISLLSPEDLEAEDKAVVWLVAMWIAQSTIETAFWPVWTIVSWWIDLADWVGNSYVVVDILKSMWIVPPEFKMEKTMLDRFISIASFLPLVTQARTAKKINNFKEIAQAKKMADDIVDFLMKKNIWFLSDPKLIDKLSDLSRDDFVRLNNGSKILWRKFTPEESKAIIDAHLVWEKRPWAGLWNYTKTELKEKIRILKGVWFEHNDIKILFDEWICGNPVKKLESIITQTKWIDYLDNLGTYFLDKDVKIKDALILIEDFAEKIDMKYLVDNPERIINMNKIIKSMCMYLIENKNNVGKFSDFKTSLAVMNRKFLKIEASNNISQTEVKAFTRIREIIWKTYNRIQKWN